MTKTKMLSEAAREGKGNAFEIRGKRKTERQPDISIKPLD